MTREKALEAMDKLVAMGYSVSLTERDMGPHGMVVVDPQTKEMTSISRHLSVHEISVDKVDLKALVAAADELGLDVGMSRLDGHFTFTDMVSDEEQHVRDVVSGRRKHPR